MKNPSAWRTGHSTGACGRMSDFRCQTLAHPTGPECPQCSDRLLTYPYFMAPRPKILEAWLMGNVTKVKESPSV